MDDKNMRSPALKGRLQKNDLARGMPCGDPIFSGPPFYWQNLERVVLTWQTDIEACLHICPDCMEVDSSATARLVLYNFHLCSLGPYHEASLQFKVNFEGNPYWFECKNLVDSDIAFAAGRELFGIPKKMGWATWEKSSVSGINIEFGRGSKVPILSAVFLWQAPFTPGANDENLPSLSVRVIPTGIGRDPEILVFSGFDPAKATFRMGADGYVYKGLCSLAFHARSLMDPWHEFTVIKMLDAEYTGGPNYLTVGTGEVLRKY